MDSDCYVRTHMEDNDDDSWEAAAQAALSIHRRFASAVRDRDTIGTRRRKVRSSKATSESRSNGKARPMSAPAGVQHRSSYSHRTPAPMLVPSLEGIPTSSISLAELEACATLTQTFENESPNYYTTLGQSRSTAGIHTDGVCRPSRNSSSISGNHDNNNNKNNLARTRDVITAATVAGPTNNQATKASKMPPSPQLDMLFDRLQRLGPATTYYYGQQQEEPHGAPPSSPGTVSSTALMIGAKDTLHTSTGTRVGRAIDGSHVAKKRYCRPASAGAAAGGGRPRARDLEGCRVALAEHLAARKRENELGRSDVSVRFLREHARKTLDEDRTFVRALRAEVKAMEDIQLESIQRATQRCRDIGAAILYLPHRVRGKLHVLKIEGSAEARQVDDETGAGARRSLQSYGKVLSIEAFMKEDFSRLKKEPSQSHNGAASKRKNKARPTSALLKDQQRKGEPGKLVVRGRPSAVDTCRDLHQLIRDIAGLVEVLTKQAEELEGQGWNREASTHQTDHR